ncbi:MAG: NAD(P)-binding domain-containing protein, partial [Usitatibacter sp.]
MANPRIGFIGIGMMGHGMARNLLEKGFPLTFLVHRDRSRIADLVAAGAKEAKSPAALANASDIVILCVSGSPQVE